MRYLISAIYKCIMHKEIADKYKSHNYVRKLYFTHNNQSHRILKLLCDCCYVYLTIAKRLDYI